MILNNEEIKAAFRGMWLEENYALLEEDLIKMANGFIEAAAPKIAKMERDLCIEFVRSLNAQVADALEAKRGPL
jgi:hypothetical protein